MAKPIRAKTIVIIQNLITIVDSAQPFFRNDDVMGPLKKTLFPVILNIITCKITESVSTTKSPPIIASKISCFAIMAIDPRELPNANEPVSPINTFAGGALNQRKPKAAPIKDPQNTDNSPAPLM